MRPDDRDLDDEIRGHLAINIKERIDGGEDPASARRAALEEFGYLPAIRESMRRVWYSRWYDAAEALARDIRFAFRSLRRAKGLTSTVVVTLALGIGANAAIFSVVRSVLLRPLVNRDADRLIYVRQTANGIGTENFKFSVPEIGDIKARARTIAAFGDFSTVDFTLIGFGLEPRPIKAGVVNGSFFEVMGLRPTLGRLLNAGDDGPKAAGAVVLTHKFWTSVLAGDPNVIGKTIRLGNNAASVVGVLEPSLPYPEETEIIANVVTSPHHLGATMNMSRTHRMTDLFGRLAPGVTLEEARAELTSVHASIMNEHPDAYSTTAHVKLEVRTLRDQLTSPARTILLFLLAAAAVVFVIACSNVANLILARSVRRESELALRAALGAGRAALRRTLLAESLVLCAAGALLALMLAQPLVSVLASYAKRFSIRALDASVDASVLWLGVGLAVVAAVLLAFVPRLPSSDVSAGVRLARRSLGGGGRMTPGTNRRLRGFATIQIACSFILLAGAGMVIATLATMLTVKTGYDMRQVLAIDLPPPATGDSIDKTVSLFEEAARRIRQLPGVQDVAAGMVAPWRDADDSSRLKFSFAVEGYQPANGEDNPTARFRPVSSRFFAVLGVPLLAGRDFEDKDLSPDTEPVAIVSQSVAQRLFPNGVALNRRVRTAVDKTCCRRIVGIVADVDDEHVVQEPSMTVYVPLFMKGLPSRLFVRAEGDPYALVPSVTRVIHDIAAEQPVENAATLEDVRSQVLAPVRLNAFVFSALGGMALLIAVVGIGGVLAFSVSARMREFGIRLALGSTPSQLLTGILKEGGIIVVTGITAGAVFGYLFARVASSYFGIVQMPGALTFLAAAAVLTAAAIVASLLPAARASRVDPLLAMRAE